ncbi:adenosylcobinamide-phosphate synthase CbiB [Nitrospirillum viridazoti]|uniref:Cobalamin biosynthesis protein CobD n=1 Tax=Nitrospirillum viridazoti CBAmc TaxID=1441467 RepID=A0A248K113_9PROT|nr:adenosylcobinamide-phosphate synthase CbiB [Nitrospirillum amazonense]ASG24657.1 cobalamin biosynthesis protein [Nitrospirillum amazonense CBAmc]TWB36974.1 adenosylcobinamide-phosphate synthase [Nitrospirillum amazonense]
MSVFPTLYPGLPWLALAALALEALLGYPDALYARIRHPVVWIGALIGRLDRAWNQEERPAAWRKAAGIAAELVLVGVALAAGVLLQSLLARLGGLWGTLATGLVAGTLLAQRSLHRFVGAVPRAVRQRGLEGGREAVSHIVGRNPASLDEAGVARAAIESLAENFSDGVVAPAFWLAVGGLPGLLAYKAINTADSMVGHRTPRHEAYGWAAARLDDVVNLPASRLTALLLTCAAWTRGPGQAKAALSAVRRDAGHHRSPNAGWPEAAMAGALGLRLAGPRTYGDVRVDDHWMGDGRAEATAADIDAGLSLYRRSLALLWGLALVLAWVL